MTINDATNLRAAVAEMLERAWREPGFCVPNEATYPHQWLWDSCFHALIWEELGNRERAATELANVLARQDEATGFVPHMTYWRDPTEGEAFWGRQQSSSLTQPPMYGHVAAALVKSGHHLSPSVSTAIERALRHLLEGRPRTSGGLVPIFHPWESGCDDSPRWDGWRQSEREWREVKADLLQSLTEGVAPTASSSFTVGSIGFNALVAWNTKEFAEVANSHELAGLADCLIETVVDQWDSEHATWRDDGNPSHGSIRTLDTLLALLVDPRQEGFDQLIEPDAFGAPFGPRGVHVAEPSYDPATYWRGPAWPQLTYLLWVAARRAERDEVSSTLARALTDGASQSGLAEYWNPETGEGLGARPQTWAGLAILV